MGEHDANRSLPGVPHGVWEYAQSPELPHIYDHAFATNDLFVLDEQVIGKYLTRPGVVIDLGCGTGRTLLPLAGRGFRAIGVDLSRTMLQAVRKKALARRLDVACVQANLVQLNCFRNNIADFVLCLFSTLGMIAPRPNRRAVLEHVHRILKPGGILVLHVHNVWFNLWDSLERRWLLRHLVEVMRGKCALGDRWFHFAGARNVFVHAYTRRELLVDLRAARLHVIERIPLGKDRRRPLRMRRWLESLRANGWIVVVRKEADD
ncbi:class I SAM-dependent methyltransferase [Thermostilla marina]